jgi:signal transduction histidine kinase/CheY-like chemotaxis protein
MNAFTTPKILIVDDLEATRFLARMVLSRNENYEFFEASNGKEGVEIALREIPHLILMDAMMPEMDGFEAISVLRNDPRTSQIPILMISALDTHDDKVRALTTGISDFIAKPFDKTELTIRVNSLLNLYLNFLRKEEELNFLNNELERKVQQRTQALRSKESYTRAILDSTPDLICVFNEGGEISDFNQAWSDFFSHIDPSKPLKNDFKFLLPYLVEMNDSNYLNAYPSSQWFEMIVGSPEHTYNLQVQKDHACHLFNVSIRNILYQEKNEESNYDEGSFILTLNDITELAHIRQERESQIKLASIGKLTAGITHEINTPLTYIQGNVELMRMELESAEDSDLKTELMENMASIEDGLRRIGNIVDATREITKKGSGQKEPTDIYSTLVYASRMVYNRAKHVTPIYLNGSLFTLDLPALAGESFEVMAIKEKLEQIWIIILNNAADEFLHQERPFDDRWIRIEIGRSEGWVEVRFHDNAGGISEKILKNIFEPFVSSKTHSGIGIGLNIARSIVQEHGGEISAHNENGGAVFTVRFPLVATV